MDKTKYGIVSSRTGHKLVGLRPGSPINPIQLNDLCNEISYAMSHVVYDDEAPTDYARVTSEINPIRYKV